MANSIESKKVGRVSELSVVTVIKKGRIPGQTITYKQQLQKVLESLQKRKEQGIFTPPDLITTIHYARWCIYEHANGDDLLIFTSNYDGELRHYIQDFSRSIADAMNLVWGNCEGYPQNGSESFEEFWQYIKAHQIETNTFYAPTAGITVKEQHKLERLYKKLNAMIDAEVEVERQGLLRLLADAS